MAMPIRNTPILFGDDARWFEQEINRPISPEESALERKRVEEGAERFKNFLETLNG